MKIYFANDHKSPYFLAIISKKSCLIPDFHIVVKYDFALSLYTAPFEATLRSHTFEINMKRPPLFRNDVVALCMLFGFSVMYAQKASLTVDEDSKVTEILTFRKRLNDSLGIERRVRIQLYYGSLSKATEIRKDFKNRYPTWETSLKFETPNYKVWVVGHYRNRLEADRALMEVKRYFPSAFLLLPN